MNMPFKAAHGEVQASRGRPPLCIDLMLQRGRALGAYQAGVYEASLQRRSIPAGSWHWS
jgi:predicted acylesterase/phospholipase RssA